MVVDSILGKLPDNWAVTTFGEVCALGGGSIQTGPFGSQLHASDYVQEGVPVVMPANIGDNKIDAEGIAHIRLVDAQRLSRHLLERGDIVYSRRGDVERRALVGTAEEGWICGTGCLKVRLGKGFVVPAFAAFYLGHPSVRKWIVRHAIGATMLNLNTSILGALPFILPPLRDQTRIAAFLGALEDKIELNRRMNQTLEAMARAIFKSWFVDFELVREGSSFHRDNSAGLPKGWSLEKLRSVASVNEQTMSIDYAHESIKYVDISSVSRGCLNEVKPFRTSEAPSRARHLVSSGDTIWSCVRPNRRSYFYVHEPPDNMVVSTGFAVLTPKRVPPSYLYSWVTTDAFVEYLESGADGSAYPAVRPGRFGDAEMLVPPDDLLNRFQDIVGPIRENVAVNDSESRFLASVRDTLLPKLLSGEICVKQAEKIVAEVL